MTGSTLNFLARVLNQFLRMKFSSDNDTVIVNRIVESDGQSPLTNQNRIVFTLLTTEFEELRSFNSFRQTKTDQKRLTVDAYSNINLNILISSNFVDYGEALKFLDATVQFFQMNAMFSSKNSPNFPNELSRLSLEPEKLTYSEINEVWNSIGTSLKPAMIYKVKIIRQEQDNQADISVPDIEM
ncbi:MAG: Pvc16 family protein [Bacteroidota bacterium]